MDRWYSTKGDETGDYRLKWALTDYTIAATKNVLRHVP